MAHVVGIDLGTTNCALASALVGDDAPPPRALGIPQVIQAGEVRSVALLPSFLYLPSEVELSDGALALPWDPDARDAVGRFARMKGATTPARLVSSAKSWLSFSGVDRRSPILPWKAPEGVPTLSPLSASARFLSHLRSAWDASHPDAPLTLQDVVLTVPASFDAVARDLTVEAAREAGLGESLRLLEEPQAALYAWLADRGADWRKDLAVGDVILVCDVGGGTTDFSLIAVQDREGSLELERIAVGDHLLLGGDNMDLALAWAVRRRLEGEGTRIDDWQLRALTFTCRVAKEVLFSDADKDAHPMAIPGRSSRLVGGTIRLELRREELDATLLDGFFPEVPSSARPQAPRRLGLTALGLPYASDAGITRHLAAFLSREGLPRGEGHSFVHPTAVLFNGGVTRSPILRERLISVLSSWAQAEDGAPPRVLEGAHPDLAVSRGAAFYAQSRRGGGVRIRGGTARAYYVGIERAELAVPGMLPRIDAHCIAPFGMEEGSEVGLDELFGLVTGEQTSFRFFGSSTRKDDVAGTIVDPRDLDELDPIDATLPGEPGQVVPVSLRARVTEVGALDLEAVEQGTDRSWKLSFDVRVR